MEGNWYCWVCDEDFDNEDELGDHQLTANHQNRLSSIIQIRAMADHLSRESSSQQRPGRNWFEIYIQRRLFPNNNREASSADWHECIDDDGRRYYHNERTNQSSWLKPLDLMTPVERAVDVSTAWKEFTTTQGRKYYYNMETNISTWTIPEELMVSIMSYITLLFLLYQNKKKKCGPF